MLFLSSLMKGLCELGLDPKVEPGGHATTQ